MRLTDVDSAKKFDAAWQNFNERLRSEERPPEGSLTADDYLNIAKAQGKSATYAQISMMLKRAYQAGNLKSGLFRIRDTRGATRNVRHYWP